MSPHYRFETEDDEQALVAALLAHGWTVEMCSMYDEEGVDGWRWEAPDGEEFYVSGVHEDGPVAPDDLTPDELTELLG